MTTVSSKSRIQTLIHDGLEQANYLKKRAHRKIARTVVQRVTSLFTDPMLGICFLNEKIAPTAEHIVISYARGMYLLSDDTKIIKWHAPRQRGIVPLDDRFHVPRSIRRKVKKENFEIHVNRDFHSVLLGCADRQWTWVNERVIKSFMELYEKGIAHSVETWRDGELVGGLFGLSIGGFYSGASRFYRVSGASDVAMIYLHEHLRERGFLLYDCQEVFEHMKIYGAYTVPRSDFHRMLGAAITAPVTFLPSDSGKPPQQSEDAAESMVTGDSTGAKVQEPDA
ncbi:MAG TPA: leucyl/phenylalanyl-tRNA--protein transferase [Aggregatilineales bacterium]|nr:leucyl/phenylalanyl-tRNA--protein transferase [Aggregatilineales bacterium]